MNGADTLSETIQFELADLAAAARLAEHLQPRWAVCLHTEDDVAVVSATLRSDAGDLALLLRTVEQWVIDESLGGILFELDGRAYMLAGTDLARAAAA